MPYLIDGHNLIPNIAGQRLSDLDDEHALVGLLQAFCQANAQSVEVFFDKAAPGQERTSQSGRLKVVFVSARSSADAAIRNRLHQLKGEARNYTVVSSDRQVQAEARAARAKVLTSPEFARLLSTQTKNTTPPGSEPNLDEAEIQDWLKLFKNAPKK